MEFVRGRTLEEVLDEQGPFGEREATLIGLDLCRALAAVHAAGIIHRDIKGSNVMREEGGRIVLMDFGAGVEIELYHKLPGNHALKLELGAQPVLNKHVGIRASVGDFLFHSHIFDPGGVDFSKHRYLD